MSARYCVTRPIRRLRIVQWFTPLSRESSERLGGLSPQMRRRQYSIEVTGELVMEENHRLLRIGMSRHKSTGGVGHFPPRRFLARLPLVRS